jgi:hypothetical protein
MSCQLRIASGTAGLLFVACLFGSPAAAHEPTARQFIRARLAAQQEAQQQAEEADADGRATCRLTIDLVDKSSGKSLPGLVRVVNVASGRPIRLAELIHRDQNWYSMNEQAVVTVPRMELRIEGVHGLVSDVPKPVSAWRKRKKPVYRWSCSGWRIQRGAAGGRATLTCT